MIRCDDRFFSLRVFEMKTLLVFWFLVTVETTRVERDRKPPQSPVEWQGYSVAFHLLLPVAGFLLLWGRRDLFNKLLLQVDRRCLSVFCPSFSKRQKLLKWAVENLPSKWSSSSKTLSGGIPDLWTDGSLLCTLINMAVPGACRNPPKHWKKPPTHAQALAYKYLSITPVFQESDFKEPLSANLERKFLLYLQELQMAVKCRSVKDASPKLSQYYLAKGMGLHNGEQYRKTTFYVYSNTNNLNCSNVLVYIRGPYDTQGTATIPAFYNLASSSVLNSLHTQYNSTDKIMFKKEARKSFLKSIALDFSSLVNFDRRSTTNDIPIHVEMETERAKVSYIPLNFGIYEVNLISNGELLINSPFSVSVSENSSGARDSFDTTEKILQELPPMRRRKIVAKFIDCINEKILLNHDSSATLDESQPSDQFSDSTPQSDKLEEEDEPETLPESPKNVVECADPKDEELQPTSGLTEPTGRDFENLSIGISTDDLCGLKSPRIVRSCDVDPETPIDSLEIYDNPQVTAPSNGAFDVAPKPEINAIDPSISTATCTSKIHEDMLMNSKKDSSEVEKSTVSSSEPEERIQKRPTSIVTPFLVTLSSGEKSNEENKEEPNIEGDITKDTNKNSTDQTHDQERGADIPYNPRKLILLRNNIKNSYVERLKAILVSKLAESENTKTIKNLVNTSNKLNSAKKLFQQDENNNSFDGVALRVTSPICPEHIASEVVEETASVSVSEKRKIFARQTCLSVPSSNNSSFSEKENEDVAKELSEKCSLRLLSVIDTIRNSTNSSLSRTISCSTPNISRSFNSMGSNSDGCKESRSSFIEAREYWLSLSTRSCSDNSTKYPKQINSKVRTFENSNFQLSYEKYRSAEDISSMARINFNRKLKKYSSLNTEDFEAIEFMSLEERKKMLLQDKYEKEKMGTRFFKKKLFVRTKSSEIENEDQREQKETQNFAKDVEKKTLLISAQEVKSPAEPNFRRVEKTHESQPTSQFKRAITFFKNLEKSAYNKKKLPFKPRPEIKRRFSLDFMEKKKERPNIGGSLRLPKTSEKFSVARIYFDIVENKRGSFRGAPNRAALSESLASLSTRTNEILDKSDDPINLGIFMNKVKPRKRRSLKSIFNIHY